MLLAAAIAAFPDKVLSIRIGKTEFSGWSSGLTEISTTTDQGRVVGYSGEVRYYEADEPRRIDKGESFQVKRNTDDKFVTVRAAARKDGGGAVRLSIAAEFE